MNWMRRILFWIVALAASFSLCAPLKSMPRAAGPASAGDLDLSPAAPALLESGFHNLYGLNFEGARAEFLSYQRMEPSDPLGKAAEAASYLYEEFNEKGVLSS